MNRSDYDDGTPTKYSWGNQSYAEAHGLPAYDENKPAYVRPKSKLPAELQEAYDDVGRGWRTWQDYLDFEARYYRNNR